MDLYRKGSGAMLSTRTQISPGLHLDVCPTMELDYLAPAVAGVEKFSRSGLEIAPQYHGFG